MAERRWRLGTATRGHPSAIVADVLRSLQMHRIAWKKVGPYTYKCRKALPAPGEPPATGNLAAAGIAAVLLKNSNQMIIAVARSTSISAAVDLQVKLLQWTTIRRTRWWVRWRVWRSAIPPARGTC